MNAAVIVPVRFGSCGSKVSTVASEDTSAPPNTVAPTMAPPANSTSAAATATSGRSRPGLMRPWRLADRELDRLVGEARAQGDRFEGEGQPAPDLSVLGLEAPALLAVGGCEAISRSSSACSCGSSP